MSFKSKIEYPAPKIPNELIIKTVKKYISQGLSGNEASRLISLQRLEDQQGFLNAEDRKEKEKYLNKISGIE